MRGDIFVSIGIPIYNAEKYLKDTIQSVINQTYTNWELILLDDGSTDGSLNIAQSFVDPRIKVVSDGLNKGLVFRLNQLNSFARGIYYARMDADDIMHVERIAKQVSFLNSHPNIDVVGTSYFSIDANNVIMGRSVANQDLNTVSSILDKGCFAHPTVMGRLDWFKKNHYDDNWVRMEDFELWIRTITNSKFANISEPLLFYRNIGIPSLKKYLKSNFGIIRFLYKADNYSLKKTERIYYCIKFILKSGFYFLFYCFGKLDFLIKRRTQSILECENKNAVFNLIQSIKI